MAQLLCLLLAGIILLPPGACCAKLAAATATPQARSCCQAKPAPHAPADRSPNANCCCRRDVVLEKPTLAFDQPLAACVAFEPVPLATPAASALPCPIHDPGPPIRILHCVWRC